MESNMGINTVNKCDCCLRERASEVYSSSLGAVSFSYCKECSHMDAEPKGIIIGTIEMLDGDVAEWVLNLTYYDTEEQTYKSAKELKKACDEGVRYFNDMDK